MQPHLSLAPRYTLDDETYWLIGIDPVRRYWLQVNGDSRVTLAIPGLAVSSIAAFKQRFLQFRALLAGEMLALPTFNSEPLEIHCISNNNYAISYAVEGAPTWHLFDLETVEAFLLAAHPDWQCAPQDIDLGRTLLSQSWQVASAA